MTVSVAVTSAPAYEASIVTDVLELTADVVIGNETVELPAGTVTLAGTEAAPLFVVRPTTIPPLGAFSFRYIVPVAEEPAVTAPGLTKRSPRTATGTRVFVSVRPDVAAVIKSGVSLVTTLVDMGKESVVWPAGTVTVGGTVAAEV